MLPSCAILTAGARAAAAAALSFPSARAAATTATAFQLSQRVAGFSSAAAAPAATPRGGGGGAAAAAANAAAAAAATKPGGAPEATEKTEATTAGGRREGASTSPSVVPDVLVSFGNQAERMTFVSHPGVMAVAKLLEMPYLTEHRAVLTQENVEAIREYDEELAGKAQVAVDEGLAVNFHKLDFFDREEFVTLFREEKKVLQQAREEVFAAPKGEYAIPACVASYVLPEIPRRWRTDMEITEEMRRVDPGLQAQAELRSLIVEHITQEKEAKKSLPSSSSSSPATQKNL